MVDARPADATATDSLLAVEARDGSSLSLARSLGRLPAYALIARRYRRQAIAPAARRPARAAAIAFAIGGSAAPRRRRAGPGAGRSGRSRSVGSLSRLRMSARTPNSRRLERAEQPVVDVAARGVAGRALVADQLAGPDALARPDRDVAEVGVDRAVAVAVVDHDDDRQVVPQLLAVEAR